MPLSPGTRLGSYEIVAPLGAGGMGEVYRARDTKLGREVAIKVLPDAFAADPERLARFTREAQTLAALNHPNIAHLHGIDESLATPALIMELVEGEDLSALLARGPVPLAEALPIARQVADALEAAHDQGIIHRDLKPANIKLRPDGTVKVLDFGLAKALDPAATSSPNVSQSPTMTARATQMGVIIGTAAYMSPEQARGKAVDRRADVWAFGVVLFEMLSGKRAFEGDDVSVTLAGVLKDDVDWSALPANTPPAILRLLRRCLEKDPRKRLSSIADARLELDEKHEPMAPAAAERSAAGRRVNAALVSAIALLAVIVTLAVQRLLPHAASDTGAQELVRLSLRLPPGDALANTDRAPLAISPDGATVVYVGTHEDRLQLFIRRLDQQDAVALPGTEGAVSPTFSPDGRWIAFFAQSKLRKISVTGSDLQDICTGTKDGRGATWSTDGRIYYAPNNFSGLWSVPATGGAPVALTTLDSTRGEISHRAPFALPDGEHLLFAIWTGPGHDENEIVCQSLKTGERHVLVRSGDEPVWLPSGVLIYSRMDRLIAVPWKPSQTSLGNAVPVTLSETPRSEGNEGMTALSISAHGTLAYLAGGPARYQQRLVWVDREGRSTPLPTNERDYERAAISPDGKTVCLQVLESSTELWMYDSARNSMTAFGQGSGSCQAPVWSPDGQYIYYRGTRKGTRNLWRRRADGTGTEEPMTSLRQVSCTPTSISPDGKWLVFQGAGAGVGGGSDIWLMPAAGGAARPLREGPATEADGQVSPDGHWLAYRSDISGTTQIYVTSFPEAGPSHLVSTGSGTETLWSRDGKQLYYVSGTKLYVMDVQLGGTFSAGVPRVLQEGLFRQQTNANTSYDAANDGRLLRIQQTDSGRPGDAIEIVLGWKGEVEKALAAH
jgi:Tol biopolymer transport system component